jgi:hypothetical protein
MGIFRQRQLRATLPVSVFRSRIVLCCTGMDEASGVVDRLHPVDKQGRIANTSPL